MRNNLGLKVMFSFFSAPNRENDNPYFADLVTNLKMNHAVEPLYISLRSLLTQKIDIIHIQWPETLVKGQGLLKKLYKWFLTSVLLTRAYINRIPVIRTVHNIEPHEKQNCIANLFLSLIDKATDFRILLNESSENNYTNSVVILHPKYSPVVATKRSDQPSGKLLAFGALRPYKGFETLIQAFSALPDRNTSLILAGKPMTEAYGEKLQKLAQADERISFQQMFLPEDTLQHFIVEADLVVLPYRNIYNSGAALLAISMGTPILATRSPSTESLQAEIGAEWVQLFDGELNSQVLQVAHTNAIRTRGLGRVVNLERRDLRRNAELHFALYRAFKNKHRIRVERPLSPDWNDKDARIFGLHSMKNVVHASSE